MRIVWIINLFPPYVMGGNEILAKDIVDELLSRGHDVFVFTGRGEKIDKRFQVTEALDIDLERKDDRFMGKKRANFQESFKWQVFDFTTYRRVKEKLEEINPELVVVDNISLISPAPLLAASASKKRMVIQANDIWLLHLLHFPGGPGLWHTPRLHRPFIILCKKILQPLFRWKVRRHRMIANSNFIRQQHVDAGYPTDKIDVVHLGIDTSVFYPRPDIEKSARFQFVFAGNLWDGKGPQVAIEAMELFTQEFGKGNCSLEIIGTGPDHYVDYLKHWTREKKISDVVYFHGFVSMEELAEMFSKSRVYLFTSIWNEPFSLTLLCAMACGVATIATTAGGTPEAIEDGETGLLVPPGDGKTLFENMKRLYLDDDFRKTLGNNAANAVKKRFTFKSYVDRLEKEWKYDLDDEDDEQPVV